MSVAVAPSPARRLAWSIRRELWENRSVYLAPLVVAGLSLVGFAVALVQLPTTFRAVSDLDPMRQQEAIQQPYVVVAMALMAIALVVAVVYSLDALYGERRDRSILFWKSLPVSDRTAVLAKASIPILVLPLITFTLTVVTQLLMLALSSVVLAVADVDAGVLRARMPMLESTGIHFVHIVGMHGLWYAPLYGWLLLVSAWARRVPFLWATLPPFAIGAVEEIAFGTTHLRDLLRDRFLGGPIPEGAMEGMTMDVLGSRSLMSFLIDPGLWLGFAVTALFLVAAVRLRRSRGPI
ncbi:MAG TPA: ABC transporter permease [Gemmatimonadota bacterium]|nr:ABC transporter permease [Gemmatimonadota bacterium]